MSISYLPATVPDILIIKGGQGRGRKEKPFSGALALILCTGPRSVYHSSKRAHAEGKGMTEIEERELLKERMKDGPPLAQAASLLRVSPQGLYRQMEDYVQGNDGAVDPDIADYFAGVLSGRYSTEEEAVKGLEQTGFLIDARKRSERERLQADWEQYSADQISLQLDDDISQEERDRRQADLDRRFDSLQERDAELGGHPLGPDEPGDFRWNKGEVRSAYYSAAGGIVVLIDADFSVCEGIEVEVLVEVEGELFAMARIRPEPGTRFAVVRDDYLQEGGAFGYQLRWRDGDVERTAGPYPFE